MNKTRKKSHAISSLKFLIWVKLIDGKRRPILFNENFIMSIKYNLSEMLTQAYFKYWLFLCYSQSLELLITFTAFVIITVHYAILWYA
jgi:hypothetical protein